ncbi:hypothetical protein DPEC_G00280180 [Dallia pectoralis]|uniref:Uncharacterized protein n=1 Tax=Dallia pectoralis TaxID=75939 RepID=A0ACC2FMM0_DALPE|nr:hypothetical protein DPEC_G00280180 [Dallia pectoralis]
MDTAGRARKSLMDQHPIYLINYTEKYPVITAAPVAPGDIGLPLLLRGALPEIPLVPMGWWPPVPSTPPTSPGCFNNSVNVLRGKDEEKSRMKIIQPRDGKTRRNIDRRRSSMNYFQNIILKTGVCNRIALTAGTSLRNRFKWYMSADRLIWGLC